MKKIIILSCSLFASISFAQINLSTSPSITNIPTTNSAFLDASSSYYIDNVGDNNIGKGLAFPQVDLTTFEFDTTTPDGADFFPTYYDGMVVYNIGEGQTVAEAAKGGVRVTVDKGFYYFFNPNGNQNGNIDAGKWVKIIDKKDLEAGLASGDFWSLNGNAGTTEATIADDTHAISGGNFIGTTDDKSVTVGTNNIARLNIGATPENVGGKDFDFVLKVYGKAKFDDGIVTRASTYPDYVFDNYFTGKSDVNPNYEFKKLNEVEKFIKENNHLPGVTKIDDLTKTENGYEVDNTQLSVQTLEKVEELYLHVIEQQKEIQALKAEIAELKK